MLKITFLRWVIRNPKATAIGLALAGFFYVFSSWQFAEQELRAEREMREQDVNRLSGLLASEQAARALEQDALNQAQEVCDAYISNIQHSSGSDDIGDWLREEAQRATPNNSSD